MLAITADNAYPVGKMLEAMQDMAWKAAALKHPNALAESTVMQLTTSIRSMMVHDANEIHGKAHTAAKEIVVCGYELMPMSLTGDSNAIIADMVKHQLDNSNYIHGYYKAVSIHSHMLSAIY